MTIKGLACILVFLLAVWLMAEAAVKMTYTGGIGSHDTGPSGCGTGRYQWDCD